MVSSDDVGKDLEHVELLKKNFDDFQKDVAANESRVDAVSRMAKKLTEEEGHPNKEEIDSVAEVKS